MDKTELEDAAFPTRNSFAYNHGMSLRDYFAAKAMLGILNDPSWRGLVCKTVAETAYEMADAMLEARK